MHCLKLIRKQSLFVLLMLPLHILAQTGTIKGRVFNEINNEPIPFASIVIQGTTTGTTSDVEGNYEITGIKPGLYNLEVTFLGFKNKIVYEVQVNVAKASFVPVAMTEESKKIEAVEITPSKFNKSDESPVSLRTIGTSEIERNPGGNRDISKAIQSLPGVSSTVSFRNDIIIRGGAPNENRFYLDGIEVPNINHFATQGSSGGPVGMINVNFIREVDFYSGAFPANRGNALSSVLEFKQKEGNSDKLEAAFIVGSSDIGLTLDGPLGKNTTYLFSARRSYLQFLFSALQLPFLPTYNDFQFKTKTNLSKKDQLTFVGLGAIDQFSLNQSVNDNITDTEVLERNQFVLDNLPKNEQWNYTVGANYKHFRENGYMLAVVSRNHLNNTAEKFVDNNSDDPNNLLFDYSSEEIENKFRLENNHRVNGWRINYGVGYEYVIYRNRTFNKLTLPTGIVDIDYNSQLFMSKYAVFGQVSNKFFNNKLTASLGIRTDLNDYSNDMDNPLDQLSPRLSLSYALSQRWALNANVGRYYQLPPYTVLGYRDNNNALVNLNNNITYIQADHFVAGVEYNTSENAKITVEGFYKLYENYPFLLNDSISLANLGGDFGVIGNEPANSTSDGRTYGLEFLYQQKLTRGFYGIAAYTLVRSEFTDKNNEFISSAWDNIHIVSITAGKKLKKDWEIGFRWRFSGTNPYTPFDIPRSADRATWDINGRGLLDFNRINSERTSVTHQLDVRVDKRYYFKKWTLNFYFDIQNLYNYQTELGDLLLVERDDNGQPVVDPDDPTKYKTKLVEDFAGNLLPSIGLIIEF